MTKTDAKANMKYIEAFKSYFIEYSSMKEKYSNEFLCFKLLCASALTTLESPDCDYTAIIHPETGEILYDLENDTPEMVYKKACRVLGI